MGGWEDGREVKELEIGANRLLDGKERVEINPSS